MNSVFTKVGRFVKVSAIASVLSLCTLQGVRADINPGGGRPPIPPSSMIVSQDSNKTVYSNGLVVFANGTELMNGVTYLINGIIILADGTILLPS